MDSIRQAEEKKLAELIASNSGAQEEVRDAALSRVLGSYLSSLGRPGGSPRLGLWIFFGITGASAAERLRAESPSRVCLP